MEEKKEKSTGGVLPAEFRAEDFMCSDRVSWSWHEEMECGVVVEGTLSYLYENEIVRLSAGDGFFMNTMTRHGIINRTKDYCLVYMIKFHPRLVGGSRDSIFWEKYLYPIIRNTAFKGLIIRRKDEPAVLRNILQACVAMRDRQIGYEFVVRNTLSNVIFSVYEKQNVVTSGLSRKDVLMEERIRTMLDYLEAHYMENVTLEEIADSAAISISECIRCFKAMVHVTPINYLRQYRLEKAADLLLHTDLSISETASYCGFEEMSYFTRCFRSQFGVTPTLYRRTYKKTG